MADPVPYTPGYSFSGFQASNPSKPLPAPRVDDELAKISQTTTETINALKDVRRSDGKLKNGIVTKDSLDGNILAEIDADIARGEAAADAAEQSQNAAANSATAAAGSAVSSAASAQLSGNYMNSSADWANQSANWSNRSQDSANASAASATRALENATQLVISTQAQAEAGTVNDKGMTPLRTLQALAEQTIQRRKTVKTITVGTGGDFATINAALTEAARFKMDYLSKGLTLEVKLLTGFVMAEQVFIVQQDFSFVTITSVDAQVTIQRSAINQNNGGSTNNWRTGTFPAWCVMRGGVLPYLKVLFAFNTTGDGIGTVGVYVFENSHAVIARGCGVKNAGWRGLYVDAGFAYARETIWDGSGMAGGPEGFSGGIRGSNGAIVMARQASAKNCATGAYFSGASGSVSDADLSGAGIGSSVSQGIGLGVQGGARVTAGGVNVANCERYGLYVADNSELYIGESEITLNLFVTATGAGINAAFVDNCGWLFAEKGVFSSTGSHAVSVAGASFAMLGGASMSSAAGRGLSVAEGSEVVAQGATITGVGDWGARVFNGSRLNATSAKIGGTSGGVQMNSASELFASGATGLDGVSTLTTNVNAGEFSLDGSVYGLDGRTQYRSTDSSSTLNSVTPEVFVGTALYTAGRTFTMYDSTAYPSKRHRIIHGGSGSPMNISAPAGVSRLAALSPGDSVDLIPNGAGGWLVASQTRTPSRRAQANTSLTVTPTMDYIKSSVSIGVDQSLTMYAASDGAVRVHTFSRTDAGGANWLVKEPGGSTIASIAANQWAVIAPLTDGSAWYVASRGSLV